MNLEELKRRRDEVLQWFLVGDLENARTFATIRNSLEEIDFSLYEHLFGKSPEAR